MKRLMCAIVLIMGFAVMTVWADAQIRWVYNKSKATSIKLEGNQPTIEPGKDKQYDMSYFFPKDRYVYIENAKNHTKIGYVYDTGTACPGGYMFEAGIFVTKNNTASKIKTASFCSTNTSLGVYSVWIAYHDGQVEIYD